MFCLDRRLNIVYIYLFPSLIVFYMFVFTLIQTVDKIKILNGPFGCVFPLLQPLLLPLFF